MCIPNNSYIAAENVKEVKEVKEVEEVEEVKEVKEQTLNLFSSRL
jgi:hypothetical protein